MCPPTDPPPGASSGPETDEQQLAVQPLGVLEEMLLQPEPVKLIYQTEARFHVDAPCRYQFLIPIKLPFIINPEEVPPPPYYPPPGTNCDGLGLHRDIHMAVLRPILAGALLELLGPDAPVDRMVSDDNLEEGVDGAVVNNSEENINFETGDWKDQYGKEGHEIDAYWDLREHIYIVRYFRFRLSWGIGVDDVDPAIVKLTARENLDDDKVVLDVSEFSEWRRRFCNRNIQESGDWEE